MDKEAKGNKMNQDKRVMLESIGLGLVMTMVFICALYLFIDALNEASDIMIEEKMKEVKLIQDYNVKIFECHHTCLGEGYSLSELSLRECFCMGERNVREAK